LIHEYWERLDGHGGEFGPIRESKDQARSELLPGARLIFSIRASSWFEAMQLYHERLEYGDFYAPEDVPDHFYTDEEAREQAEYLRRRTV
jgi:hypothetical protein